jgi:hypothetical protein
MPASQEIRTTTTKANHPKTSLNQRLQLSRRTGCHRLYLRQSVGPSTGKCSPGSSRRATGMSRAVRAISPYIPLLSWIDSQAHGIELSRVMVCAALGCPAVPASYARDHLTRPRPEALRRVLRALLPAYSTTEGRSESWRPFCSSL